MLQFIIITFCLALITAAFFVVILYAGSSNILVAAGLTVMAFGIGMIIRQNKILESKDAAEQIRQAVKDGQPVETVVIAETGRQSGCYDVTAVCGNQGTSFVTFNDGTIGNIEVIPVETHPRVEVNGEEVTIYATVAE